MDITEFLHRLKPFSCFADFVDAIIKRDKIIIIEYPIATMRYSFKLLTVVLLAIWMSNPTNAKCRNTLYIESQEQFDRLQAELAEKISDGVKNIRIIFSPGIYVANEDHIRLSDIDAPQLKITIVGNGASIVGKGSEYKSGDRFKTPFSPFYSWMDGDADISVWSDVRYAEGMVEVVDEKNKRCRIGYKGTLPHRVKDAFIHIPHWYKSSIYPIESIDEKYIYFVASDLAKSPIKGYNLNDDYNYGGQKQVRYKLSNVLEEQPCVKDGKLLLPKSVNSVRVSTVQRYITVRKCHLHSIIVRNLHFLGNCSENAGASVYISNNQCEKIVFSHCQFNGIKSDVITIRTTPNVRVEQCVFQNCYMNGITSDNGSPNTVVSNNAFSRMGKRMLNLPCVTCNGSDYVIKNNSFTDYGYCGIGVGVWYNAPYDNPCKGEISDNSLAYTDAYVYNIANYALMDGGAIYVWTKNDGTIIRNNIIQNYIGLHYSHGIYCDDGAYNIQIEDNVITGIKNGMCIDSRRVSNVEDRVTPGSGIERSNINVVVRGNIVDGKISVVGNEMPNNGCVKGTNYILLSEKDNDIQSTYKNINIENDDVQINYIDTDKGRKSISRKDYRMLSKVIGWKSIRDGFTR